MDKRTIIAIATGFLLLTSGTSCEKVEVTRSIDSDDNEVRIGDSGIAVDTIDERNSDAGSGISFDLGSDSLEVEIEDVYFHPKDWEEESIDTEL